MNPLYESPSPTTRMNHNLARGTTSPAPPQSMTMNTQRTELLTAYELSILLQTTMRAVYRLVSTGTVPTRMVGGVRYIEWPVLRVLDGGEQERAA